LLAIIADEGDARLSVDARASLIVLAAQLQALQTLIGSIEKRLLVQHRANAASKRLESIPGIGIIGASAIAATVTDPKAFRSGRDFAAWIGLVPRQDSTGGKQKLGPISKQGDRYLRRILVVGAHSALRRAKQSPEKYPWLTQLLARRPVQGGGGCARQQDGPHRLGVVGQRRHLPGTSGHRGVIPILRLSDRRLPNRDVRST
jgi:transposase